MTEDSTQTDHSAVDIGVQSLQVRPLSYGLDEQSDYDCWDASRAALESALDEARYPYATAVEKMHIEQADDTVADVAEGVNGQDTVDDRSEFSLSDGELERIRVEMIMECRRLHESRESIDTGYDGDTLNRNNAPYAVVAVVTFKDLVGWPELNGSRGTLDHYMEESGRWKVTLEGGGVVNAFPKNIILGSGTANNPDTIHGVEAEIFQDADVAQQCASASSGAVNDTGDDGDTLNRNNAHGVDDVKGNSDVAADLGMARQLQSLTTDTDTVHEDEGEDFGFTAVRRTRRGRSRGKVP